MPFGIGFYPGVNDRNYLERHIMPFTDFDSSTDSTSNVRAKPKSLDLPKDNFRPENNGKIFSLLSHLFFYLCERKQSDKNMMLVNESDRAYVAPEALVTDFAPECSMLTSSTEDLFNGDPLN